MELVMVNHALVVVLTGRPSLQHAARAPGLCPAAVWHQVTHEHVQLVHPNDFNYQQTVWKFCKYGWLPSHWMLASML
jgi:hypothetical protein